MTDTIIENEAVSVVPAGGSSLMAQLREKRAAASKIITVDLDVPGYGGTLVARYRLIDPLVEGKEIGSRIMKQFRDEEDREFWALLDTLIAACEGLYMRGSAGTLEPIDPDEDGEPVRYDKRLADGLGIDAGDPFEVRKVVLGLFNGNKVAVKAQALALAQWMADPAGNVSLGEA